MKISEIIKNLLNKSIKAMTIEQHMIPLKLDKRLKKIFKKKIVDSHQSEIKDYLYLSKNSTFKKITEILESGRNIICDLHDRNGKIGLEITGILNNFEQETCTLTLKGGEKHDLNDKFLYNLIYNIKTEQYSIEEQDEYFEKIEKEND